MSELFQISYSRHGAGSYLAHTTTLLAVDMNEILDVRPISRFLFSPAISEAYEITESSDPSAVHREIALRRIATVSLIVGTEIETRITPMITAVGAGVLLEYARHNKKQVWARLLEMVGEKQISAVSEPIRISSTDPQ